MTDTKRLFDLAVTLPAFAISLPVQAVVALAVRSKLGSPVLFTQERPGLGGRTFVMRKFRTMLEPDPARGLVTDADRLTPFGTFLRSTSLDELPTLWNIVRGDMSLVGPRPLLVRYLDRYSPEQARRHDVRPGLTGLAQVSGRNAMSWEQRLALDVDYVDTHTLRGDLAIIVRTVSAVLRRDGIAAEGEVTMSEFDPHERTN
ncbi:probable glycosyl transferase transmembrane protein [Janibacter sp. HTCC2649]|uniref:sugar transferase n=1 Tax=Janibacter sp. HTCC2649 TaxID=313589 RepID=UPI000067106E|nr:sugar transferase [Janibacter sp. HTCC2649]EAP97398.1 probable glycosyl transferase transmembrane protein [Janibacter sp. HTCC2649]